MRNRRQEAARLLRDEMVAAVAAHWEIPAKQVGVALGFYYDKGDSGRQLVQEVIILAEAKRGRPLGATGGYRTRKVGGDYRGGTIGASPAYSTTAHIAEVTVDEETGIVRCEKVWVAHDCGKAINPTLVEGQIEGSVYMGYAEAIMEAQLYDERGLHLGPNLLDYAIPTAVETPDILADCRSPRSGRTVRCQGGRRGSAAPHHSRHRERHPRRGRHPAQAHSFHPRARAGCPG